MPRIDESLLDDVERLAALDPHDTLRALATAGAQTRRALTSAHEAGIGRLSPDDRPRAVLVAALGGSSIIGDVLAVLAELASPVPVSGRHATPLPGWVGPLDLVIAVSQSGHAAGPVALAAEAARRGAGLLTVGAADSPLAEVSARGRGIHVPVEMTAPSSRTALWSLLVPVLAAAHRLGLVDCPDPMFERVAGILDERAEECRPTSESFVNPAKALALDLAERIPVVLGDGTLTGAAAARAASMVTGSARIPATHGALPAAATNVVACFDGPYTRAGANPLTPGGDIFADPYLDGPPAPQLGLLMLRDGPGQPAAPDSRLADAVVAAAEGSGVRVSEVTARGVAPLERWASLVGLTDFVATYLALGLGMDPRRSPRVTELRDLH